jgi:hypothetical protein
MATSEQLISQRADALESELTLKAGEPAVCVSLRTEARMHQWFVLLYQTLVFVLALATVLLLIGSLWRVWKDADVAAALQAAGAVVTGVAAGWVEKQRRDARVQLRAAHRAMTNNKCQAQAQ